MQEQLYEREPYGRVPTVRIAPNNEEVLEKLGLLRELAGTWEGEGFNLIARPAFELNANLYLQLNRTREVLKIDPIGSAIPNRGFGQKDIELHGLTYLQKINDYYSCGGALHIEPGLWVTQPATSYPPETAPAKANIVARMGSIPHGNALLAAGSAQRFSGTPVLRDASGNYGFSQFPSFNSVPFPETPPIPVVVNAAGSSSALTPPPGFPFSQYNMSIPAGPANPRSPYLTCDPPIDASTKIDGVPMQDLVNDPILLLERVIAHQLNHGHHFEGTVINIASQKSVTFFTVPNSPPGGPTVTVNVNDGAGGIENIQFLEGGEPVGPKGPNADTALVYATFWIEKVKHPHRPHFMQLQYAQMVVLDFGILNPPPPGPPPGAPPFILGWPHISVATLRKTFN
ncbi:MAG TPA: heme-binding protein [Bryobacteraceae bacterium]|jgi:hypothetical protein|nr:heme-binding protein [Bryobacteraceae bacterium]